MYTFVIIIQVTIVLFQPCMAERFIMGKYIVESTCIAMTNDAASFNVLVKEETGSSTPITGVTMKNFKTIAEGNVIINSLFRRSSCLNFFSAELSQVSVTDAAEEHCIERAYVIFQPAFKREKEKDE